MFRPGSPGYEELLHLASLATRYKLLDSQRARWRELTTRLLGSIREHQTFTPERQYLRAPVELEVDILAPDEMASLATSTIGAGGLSIRIAEEIPTGTQVDLSIKLPGRRVPLLAKGQVVWSYPGAVGVAFVDLFQHDREHLEALAVQALLRGET
ncbi:MAG TPA: PilZ domain-containing protein [Myxococcales bacterium]|nr:PilZ domain-containing protein [Myxococcales bacterium]